MERPPCDPVLNIVARWLKNWRLLSELLELAVGVCNMTRSLRDVSTGERKRIVSTSSGRFKLANLEGSDGDDMTMINYDSQK